MYALTDASLAGLGFVLLQKDVDGKSSILQVGPTGLKNAQDRWAPTELEVLAIRYCLTKCHFFTECMVRKACDSVLRLHYLGGSYFLVFLPFPLKNNKIDSILIYIF